MKASAYLQIVPERARNGTVRKLKIIRATQTPPTSPEPGALLLRVELEVPVSVFEIPTAHVELIATEEEISAATVPVPVPSAPDSDPDDPADEEDEDFPDVIDPDDDLEDDGGIGFDNRDHGDL